METGCRVGFSKAQIYDLLPELRRIPVLRFLTGNLYFLLDAKKTDRQTLYCELMQVGFDKQAGDCYPMKPFKQEEPAVRLRDGKLWPSRYKLVDWRFVEPEEILKLQKLLPHVMSVKDHQTGKKLTDRFSSDNVYAYRDKYVEMGPATTPQNPDIVGRGKSSLIVGAKPWA